ncbi:aminotransferase class I/II-fold pyridoxal phosphate-dependent enzyme [Brevibacterium marinum]|uniref:Arginine/lysine/ornithine decarboxylase n=1 Tax=Brevibacterium marinum TaxID=418643 RepID=A0A846RZT0_9MICO|nr:aminotransferase class I/II-fold pyridoxal phosphate-dependent enzyme [Brevibacterium marinum]NJC55471.1 arginine/lysine/ornithine decarboxylase [Brevibacterium marinum]
MRADTDLHFDTTAAIDPRQHTAPYAEAVRSLAAEDWQRLHVPAHQGSRDHAPGLAEVVGEAGMGIDFPVLFSGVDQENWRMINHDRVTPILAAQRLAAEAWGASRTWFLTNGASGGNHIATTIVRGLGREFVVQRSVHSSVIDGVTHAELRPHFVHGRVDPGLGSSHGVTPAQVESALTEHPGSAAVYLVSPSYFGAVADIAAIAEVAHRHGVPLIVDEAWASHFGMHSILPVNAVRLGADLVISSTHKGAGSLAQSAMVHLGHGPLAQHIETLVDRVVKSYQSTSSSAILLSSLDEARRHLVTHPEAIESALGTAEEIRNRIRDDSRFRDATPDILGGDDAIDNDPFKVVIDTRGAGITGEDAQYRLIRDHRIYCELATPSALLLLIGATSPVDVDRFWTALQALPTSASEPERPIVLPGSCEKRLEISDAYFAEAQTVPFAEAVGRISADALAAYPPGVPNVLPGEVLSAEVVEFLRATAVAPSGYVRGAQDSRMDTFNVVAEIR